MLDFYFCKGNIFLIQKPLSKFFLFFLAHIYNPFPSISFKRAEWQGKFLFNRKIHNSNPFYTL